PGAIRQKYYSTNACPSQMPVFIHVNIYYTGPAERSEGGWGIGE
ncbi:unnamed protein product, partial [marine sediment metagenome]